MPNVHLSDNKLNYDNWLHVAVIRDEMRFDLEGLKGKGTALEMHTIEFRGNVELIAKL